MGTSELFDVDDTDCNPVVLFDRNVNRMGSFKTEPFVFELALNPTFSQEVKKADDCRIRINYTFRKDD